MKTEWTPGPWRAVEHCHISKEGRLWAIYGEVGPPLAFVPRDPNISAGYYAPHEWYGRNEANRDLIVLTPKLVKIFLEIMEWHEGPARNPPSEMWTKARDLIAELES